MKLFKIEKNDCCIEINILGIKIKFTDYKQLSKNLEKRILFAEGNIHNLLYGSRFVYTNGDKISKDNFVRFCSNRFYDLLGYFPNLKNPRSFNEKINWMKYNYYNPIENSCCDKYTAKQYFTDKVGEEYTVPLLGVWDDVNDIDFDKLPEQIVFKNRVSGGAQGVKIVRNKSKIDLERLKYELNSLLFDWNNDGYTNCLNPKRKEIKERLIAEEYIEQFDGQVYDYKFFCFHGKVKFLYVAKDHFPGQVSKISFYTPDMKPCGFWNACHPQIEETVSVPKNFDKMIEISEKLAEDFPFVRVDLYNIDGKIYVGELTFVPTGGFLKFNEIKYDFEIGKLLDLTKINPKFFLKPAIIETVATTKSSETRMVAERNSSTCKKI